MPICISIKQPWAWAILNLDKDIENRSWKFPGSGGKTLPCTLYIHASKTVDKSGIDWIKANFQSVSVPTNLPTGVILGSVTVTECVQNSSSLWAIPGQYHWKLKNPKTLVKPVPFKGQLGIFSFEESFGEESFIANRDRTTPIASIAEETKEKSFIAKNNASEDYSIPSHWLNFDNPCETVEKIWNDSRGFIEWNGQPAKRISILEKETISNTVFDMGYEVIQLDVGQLLTFLKF